MPVAVSSCGGVWGSGDPPTTGSLSPGPCPLLQAPVLGRGGLSSLRADPASILPPVKPVQEPPGMGTVPWAALTQLGFSSHPTGGCGGTAGTAGSGQGTVTVCRAGGGGGGCGGPRGSELHGPAGVALQQAHDGRVALGPSDELLQRELPCGEGDTAQPPPGTRHPPCPGGAPWGARHPEPLRPLGPRQRTRAI